MLNNPTTFENTQTIGNPEWKASISPGMVAPLVGGRIHQRVQKTIGCRTLAHFATIADIESPPATVTDLFSNNAIYGNNVVKFTSVSATQVILAPKVAQTVPVNVTNGIIKFSFIPVLSVTNMDRYSIELHSAGTPAAPSSNYHTLDTTAQTAPGDFKQRLTSSTGLGRIQAYGYSANQFVTVGTGADLTNITFARILLRSAGSMTMYIGNIEFVPNKLSKARFILTFDDGYQSQNTIAAPAMAKYNFRGVLYNSPVIVNTDINSSYMTVANMINLHDNLGWQTASQAYSTEAQATIDGMTPQQRTAELSKLRNIQNTWGLSGGQDGSYFSGVNFNDMPVFQEFRKSHRTQRAFFGGNGSGVPFTYGEMFPFPDPMLVRSLNGETWTGTNNGTQNIAHIDQAIANKGVAIFTWHNGLNTAGNIRDGFMQLLAYCDTKRDVLENSTMEELFY